MPVRVQEESFNLGAELAAMSNGRDDVGAIVSFTGVVRQNADNTLTALELEHYPLMTAKALEQIEAQAITRWDLCGSLIIHRVGRLGIGEQIMMVATAAPHRGAAFQAAEFLMDYLKSRAPFWKKEHLKDGSNSWVDAREADENSLRRWEK